MPSSSVSGAPAWPGTLLCPRPPGSSSILRSRKRAFCCSVVPFGASGSSDSRVIAANSTFIAAEACSRETSGFRRARM